MNGLKFLQVGCENIDLLVSKVLYVRHFMRFRLSIVTVWETYLVPSISSSFAAIERFQIVRGDG